MKIQPIQIIKFLRETEKSADRINKQKNPLLGASAAKSFLMTARHLAMKFDGKEEVSLIPGVDATILEATFRSDCLSAIIGANPSIPSNAAAKLDKIATLEEIDKAMKALDNNTHKLKPRPLFLRRLYVSIIIYVRLIIFIQLNYMTISQCSKNLVKGLLNEYIGAGTTLLNIAASPDEDYPEDITGSRMFQSLSIYNKGLRNTKV